MKHSEYYYEYTRNMKDKKNNDLTKLFYEDIPNYYKGDTYGYEARKVIEDWNLSYNIGTAVSYLLRCNYKHTTPIDDIKKAINHLQFELDKLNNDE